MMILREVPGNRRGLIRKVGRCRARPLDNFGQKIEKVRAFPPGRAAVAALAELLAGFQIIADLHRRGRRQAEVMLPVS
jgi:hypothetical protein